MGETGEGSKEGADGTVKTGMMGHMWQLLVMGFACHMILWSWKVELHYILHMNIRCLWGTRLGFKAVNVIYFWPCVNFGRGPVCSQQLVNMSMSTTFAITWDMYKLICVLQVYERNFVMYLAYMLHLVTLCSLYFWWCVLCPFCFIMLLRLESEF
jgi:hypothetical protein